MTTIVPQNVSITRPDGVTIEIPNITLSTWKAALKLELVGLRVTRGGKVSTIVRKHLNMSRTTSVEDMLKVVTNILDQYFERV